MSGRIKRRSAEGASKSWESLIIKKKPKTHQEITDPQVIADQESFPQADSDSDSNGNTAVPSNIAKSSKKIIERKKSLSTAKQTKSKGDKIKISKKTNQKTLKEQSIDNNKKFFEKIQSVGETFFCQDCDFVSTQKLLAKTHVQSCEKKRKSKKPSTERECTVCNEQFPSVGALKWHFINVHQRTTYKCVKCDGEFETRNHFLNHLKYVHFKSPKNAKAVQSIPEVRHPIGDHTNVDNLIDYDGDSAPSIGSFHDNSPVPNHIIGDSIGQSSSDFSKSDHQNLGDDIGRASSIKDSKAVSKKHWKKNACETFANSGSFSSLSKENRDASRVSCENSAYSSNDDIPSNDEIPVQITEEQLLIVKKQLSQHTQLILTQFMSGKENDSCRNMVEELKPTYENMNINLSTSVVNDEMDRWQAMSSNNKKDKILADSFIRQSSLFAFPDLVPSFSALGLKLKQSTKGSWLKFEDDLLQAALKKLSPEDQKKSKMKQAEMLSSSLTGKTVKQIWNRLRNSDKSAREKSVRDKISDPIHVDIHPESSASTNKDKQVKRDVLRWSNCEIENNNITPSEEHIIPLKLDQINTQYNNEDVNGSISKKDPASTSALTNYGVTNSRKFYEDFGQDTPLNLCVKESGSIVTDKILPDVLPMSKINEAEPILKIEVGLLTEKSIQDKCKDTLKQVLKDKDNMRCADCENMNPRFASWNLGIFLCSRCARMHRNLSENISKVKSVDDDTWEPVEVLNLQTIGNKLAKAVYEANLPEDNQLAQDDISVEAFIWDKYEVKKFVVKERVLGGHKDSINVHLHRSLASPPTNMYNTGDLQVETAYVPPPVLPTSTMMEPILSSGQKESHSGGGCVTNVETHAAGDYSISSQSSPTPKQDFTLQPQKHHDYQLQSKETAVRVETIQAVDSGNGHQQQHFPDRSQCVPQDNVDEMVVNDNPANMSPSFNFLTETAKILYNDNSPEFESRPVCRICKHKAMDQLITSCCNEIVCQFCDDVMSGLSNVCSVCNKKRIEVVKKIDADKEGVHGSFNILNQNKDEDLFKIDENKVKNDDQSRNENSPGIVNKKECQNKPETVSEKEGQNQAEIVSQTENESILQDMDINKNASLSACKKFQCDNCGMSGFRDIFNLKRHIEKLHSVINLLCKKCEVTFVDRYAYMVHSKDCYYFCKKCAFLTKREAQLKIHERKHKNDQEL